MLLMILTPFAPLSKGPLRVDEFSQGLEHSVCVYMCAVCVCMRVSVCVCVRQAVILKKRWWSSKER